jgi:hypothetical protein
MRCWIVGSTAVTLSWLVGCQPAPAEVETFAGTTTSGGSSSTTAITEPATSAPTDTTVAASGSGGSTGGSSLGIVDSSSSDGGSSDATSDSTGEPTDEPLGPFGTPVAVAELNDFAAEDDPTLTADMLEIYFGSTRSGFEDVWMSTRSSVDDVWDAPTLVDTISSGTTDTLVEVSADGLFILLASDRAAIGDQDVYFSERGARGQPWPAPLPLQGAANAGSNDFGVTPSPDLMSAFMCRAPLGQSEIYEGPADFTSWMVFEPAVVAELSSPEEDCSVTLSQSRREIFFETTRPASTFGWNLFTATREDPADAWSAPVEVTELSSNADEQDPWLSPDRHTLYFASSRTGNLELYVATRP